MLSPTCKKQDIVRAVPYPRLLPAGISNLFHAGAGSLSVTVTATVSLSDQRRPTTWSPAQSAVPCRIFNPHHLCCTNSYPQYIGTHLRRRPSEHLWRGGDIASASEYATAAFGLFHNFRGSHPPALNAVVCVCVLWP